MGLFSYCRTEARSHNFLTKRNMEMAKQCYTYLLFLYFLYTAIMKYSYKGKFCLVASLFVLFLDLQQIMKFGLLVTVQ